METPHIMKKHILVVTLITAASVGACLCQSPTPSPPRVVCQLASRDVELYGFYGTKKIVAERVANLPVNLSERRAFLQITESGRKSGAKIEVKLFERQQDGRIAVTKWTKAKAPGLFDAIDRAIFENKGKRCVGEAVKAVLIKVLGPGKSVAPLAPATSPKDAFAPSVQDASGDFAKSVIILNC